MMVKKNLERLLHTRAFYYILVAFVVLAIVPLVITDSFFLFILTDIVIFAVYASSWNFLSNSGQGSLGHAVFLGIGGFSSALIGGAISTALAGALGSYLSVGPLSLLVQILALLFGGLLSAGIGLLIGLACVRLKAWYLAMVTFGFSVIADSLSSQFDSITHGIDGFRSTLLVSSGFPYYLLVISFAVVSISLMYLIMRSRMGLAFRAIRENEAEAKMIGINTAKYKLIAFVISTFFAGIAGGLYIFFIRYVDNSIFSPANSFTPLIMSVIGGLGTITGPIFGSVILISVQQILALPGVIDPLQKSLGWMFPGVSNVGPPLTYLAIGVFLVVIVIFAPKGVNSLIQRLYIYLRPKLVVIFRMLRRIIKL